MEDNIGNDREAAIIIFVFKKTPPARRSGGTIGAGVFSALGFTERTSSISHHTSSIFPCPCTLQPAHYIIIMNGGFTEHHHSQLPKSDFHSSVTLKNSNYGTQRTY